jgi:hypothetical protein
MRTIERTNQFKRDYKRETKGRSGAYVRKLDSELGAVVPMPAVDGTLDPRRWAVKSVTPVGGGPLGLQKPPIGWNG